MALEHEGWEVHDQVEHPSHHAASLEEFKGTEEEKEGSYLKQLKEAAESKRALIIRNSHMGGHKFAGNCIVSIPNLYSLGQPVESILDIHPSRRIDMVRTSDTSSS